MQGIFDIFSGGGSSGYGDIQAQLQKAMDEIRNNYGQGREALQPWQQAGQNMLPGYEQSVNQGQNPFDFSNQIGQNYQTSQYAQNNMNAITQAMNNAAAASGMAGTPGVQQALAGKISNISNQDQQQYFNNIMGIKNQYMQGANDLLGYGYGAANGINNSFMGQGNAMAGLYGDMGNAQLGQRQANASGWGNIISGGANAIPFFM